MIYLYILLGIPLLPLAVVIAAYLIIGGAQLLWELFKGSLIVAVVFPCLEVCRWFHWNRQGRWLLQFCSAEERRRAWKDFPGEED